MATYQTTYPTTLTAAVAGQIANMEKSNVLSKRVEDSGGVGFGKAVFQGTADDQVTGTASALFVGISVKDVTIENDTTADEYEADATAAILEEGVIWVTAGGSVSAGAAVTVASDGDFEEAASGNTAIDAIFVDSGSAADLVRIRVR